MGECWEAALSVETGPVCTRQERQIPWVRIQAAPLQGQKATPNWCWQFTHTRSAMVKRVVIVASGQDAISLPMKPTGG